MFSDKCSAVDFTFFEPCIVIYMPNKNKKSTLLTLIYII
jgi:hypothetical protein